MDMITRAVVAPALVEQWLPAVGGIVARLSAGAAVADVGCGYGAACIAMAEAFPASRLTGFDIDDASVARARRAALAAGVAGVAGVAERVSFEVAAAADISGGPYDLVTFIDSLHDLGDPAGALRRARQVLADDGVVLLAEHAGSGKLEENLHPAGRFFYAASALVCVPNALSGEHPEEPLGSIPGEQSLRRVASAAGFSRVRRVEAGAPLNLLLELRL
jgi:SAM-dependent methyltransferase